jgi:hypothetical protein
MSQGSGEQMTTINPALLFQGEAHIAKRDDLKRDTQLLNGEITFEQKRVINRKWARASHLGLLGIMAVKARRDSKRGFEI